MFTWICPKCGKEVPPAYTECPNCAPAESTAPPQAPNEPKAAEPVQPLSQPATPPPVSAPPRVARKTSAMPGWLMALLFAAAFIAIGAGLITVLRSRSRDSAEAANPPAAQANAPRLPDAAAVKAHPLVKSIELTGLRFTEDAKQKAWLQFVIVNHSAADIAGLTANARIVAVNGSPDAPPMGTFIIKTDLAPYEAKNMRVPVETKLRAYELPDWQFIRADLDITAP